MIPFKAHRWYKGYSLPENEDVDTNCRGVVVYRLWVTLIDEEGKIPLGFRLLTLVDILGVGVIELRQSEAIWAEKKVYCYLRNKQSLFLTDKIISVTSMLYTV